MDPPDLGTKQFKIGSLGKNEDGSYHPRSPRLLWWRIGHRLFGRMRGCSCSTCFHHPRRRVPASEFYRLRQRLAELERKVG